MSAHYDTEPPPTASVTLHTTAGPIQISLFARQTPLACKNFIQHCLDGYYTGTTFHRVVSDFIIQGGDPTGTGSGGSSIYEDSEFEFDTRDGEKVVFGDEIHSRLRFNRRGLVGMAKSEDGSYGSQFFVTLGNVERQLNKACTMFGRVEGDSIYNIVKIAEGEVAEGTDRPVYAIKITGCEVGEMGPFEGVLRPREKIAVKKTEDREREREAGKGKKKKKSKAGKALLSFGVDEGEEGEETISKPTKPKFNTKLVKEDESRKQEEADREKSMPKHSVEAAGNKSMPAASKPSTSASQIKSPSTNRIIPTRDPHTQLPLPDDESASRSPSLSPSPSPNFSPRSPQQSRLSRTNAEIAALKASMRRDTTSTPTEPSRKKTALESLIPETSIRGRKRPAPGTSSGGNGTTSKSQDKDALRMFNAFKSRLESADTVPTTKKPRLTEPEPEPEPEPKSQPEPQPEPKPTTKPDEEPEEEQVCDLHFIANCQSCRAWDAPEATNPSSNETNGVKAGDAPDDNEVDWMTHKLQFGKDTLGKDLNWKRAHQDADSLVVIDPRQKEKEVIGGSGSGGRKRERERKRKMEDGAGREWDRKDAKAKIK